MKYVIEDRDRHGNLRRYYWRKGCPKIRLRGQPGTPEFAAEVKAAQARLDAERPISRPPGHYVYIIHAHGSGRVKIGISANAERRLAGLQTGSGSALRLGRLFRVGGVDDARKIERAAHRHLAKWRTSGEWFRLRLNHTATTLMGLAAELGIEIDDMLIHRSRKDGKLPPTKSGGSFSVISSI
jgi:predicted GIY-YIG superfamily endonuclease